MTKKISEIYNFSVKKTVLNKATTRVSMNSTKFVQCRKIQHPYQQLKIEAF